MLGQKLLVLAVGGACFSAFSWGMFRHFRCIGPMPVGMRLIGAVSFVSMVVFTWSVLAVPLSGIWPAAPILSAAALALFGWAVATTRYTELAVAFTPAQPPVLVTSGPFRYVRHPFYTSYLLFWLATGVATTSGICWIGPAILLGCYIIAARGEEHLISHGRLGAEYASYASRTGILLPRLMKKRQRAFSWRV